MRKYGRQLEFRLESLPVTDRNQQNVRHAWRDAGTAICRNLRQSSGVALLDQTKSVGWSWLAGWVDKFIAGLDALGIGQAQVVAVPGRNDFQCAAAVLALTSSDRPFAIFNPFQPSQAMLASARACRPDLIVMAEQDIVKLDRGDIDRTDRLAVMKPQGELKSFYDVGRRDPRETEAGLFLATSGTTGDPKWIKIRQETISRALAEIALFNRGFGDRRRANGSWAPLIQYSPLAHVGGALTLLRAAAQGRPNILLQKFDPLVWAQAVREFRLHTTGLPPAMMRMVLDTAISPSDLSSLVSVWSGTAPVRSVDRDEFSGRYGLPVLGNYGATEFCGAVAAWTLIDYHSNYQTKANAVGRINPAVARARIRGADGSIISERGAVGALELRVHRIGSQWLSTNDSASLDDEGFLFLHGRNDDVIMRGGFKLKADKIARVLSEHPLVKDAVVIGITDQRLGQVPAAVLETSVPEQIDQAEILAFVRSRLPAYFVPVAIRAVGTLPRTRTMKLDRRAVRELFDR